MVQKKKKPLVATSEKRGRGRPRGYQPDEALAQALAQFRKTGFAATSLDDLTAATGLNKPSLYGAFGDKRALYIESLKRYGAEGRAAFADVLGVERPLRETLTLVFGKAIEMYVGSDVGCFTVLTAASEAIADPEIRDMVAKSLEQTDAAFAHIFARAKQAGELSKTADPQMLAQLASATLHTLSVRARARLGRQALEATAEHAVNVLLAAAGA